MTGMGFLRDLQRGLLQLFLPNTCWICQQDVPEADESFCVSCLGALTTDPFGSCPRCGGTVGPYVPLVPGCVHCRDESFAFDGVVRLGPYDGLLRAAILRMKSGEALAEALSLVIAQHLAPAIAPWRPDLVVPVPLHWLRYLHRGFNQSEILARNLADKLGIPCRPRLLRRVRRTLSQTSRTPAQRRENVRAAFAARRDPAVEGRTVLLVDDVLTTGATAHNAAQALRTLKPARVHVCVLARAAS